MSKMTWVTKQLAPPAAVLVEAGSGRMLCPVPAHGSTGHWTRLYTGLQDFYR